MQYFVPNSDLIALNNAIAANAYSNCRTTVLNDFSKRLKATAIRRARLEDIGGILVSANRI